MKVKFEIEIKNLIWFAVMSVLAAVLFFITEYPWWVMVGFWAVYFVVVCLKFELDEKLLWLWSSVLMLGGSVLTMFSIQYLLLEPELFAKTIREAARGAHKRLRQVEFHTQAPDHPILWAAEESYYLKFYIFQVCEER